MKKISMKKFTIVLGLSAFMALASCDTLNSVAQNLPNDLGYPNGGISANPTENEMISALKEALQVGSNNAANILHTPGGYLNNPLIRIPFPPDAQKVADELRKLGFGDKVDKFIETMNRGAEDAAIKAAPIFVDAIRSMTVTDAKNILLGADNSATSYFRSKTTTPLYNSFSPVIKSSLDKVNATKYWTDITTIYNKIPFVKPVQTDLVKYTTDKALDGLFVKVADEEKSIRTNIASRTSDQLKKVFGWAQSMKKG
jgi:hypothetical protein